MRTHTYHQVLVSHELGGAGLIALNLARYLRSRDRDCRVWIPGKQGAAWNEAVRFGLPVQSYVPAHDPARIPAAIANWRFGRALRKERRGLVHVHSPLQYGRMRWGLRLSGLPRVVHVHLEEDQTGLRWAFREPPEVIVTCAKFLLDQVQRSLPEHAKHYVRLVALPNAVDVERFAPGPKQVAKERVGARGDRPLVLMLANLAPHKGQETAIRAVALLKQRGTDMTLWLAGMERGSGLYVRRLEQLIVEQNVGDRVTLLGHRNDAPELLRAADFFLLPSTNEGLPLSVLEAQASRTLVLVAPTAGIPEVVTDGVTGWVISADDPAGYADRLERMHASPEVAKRLVETAFEETVREHSWQSYCAQTEALYDRLLRSEDRP